VYRPAVSPSVLAANWLPRMTKQPSTASQPEVASCSGPLQTNAFPAITITITTTYSTLAVFYFANSSKNAVFSISYISGYVTHLVLYYMLQSTYPSTQMVTSLMSIKHSKALFGDTFIIASIRLLSPFIYRTSLISYCL
jgi:hypothetical protein